MERPDGKPVERGGVAEGRKTKYHSRKQAINYSM